MPWFDVVALAVVGIPVLACVACLGATLLTMATVPLLRKVLVGERPDWPTLSVISPACNEAEGIEDSLRSLLGQDYPALELVAINDRSTDDTGAIIDRLAAVEKRLTAVHITTLPDGWLGKLNALQHGAERSHGEWLLFADADVQFAPGALKQAITFAERQGLDLLTAIPEVETMGLLGDCVFNTAGVLFCAGGRMWSVKNPASSAIAGVGAFILVRRSAFARTPGFHWLRLEVADDMGLGLLIKSHGGRCDIVNGRGAVKLKWYASFTDLRNKMQKNFFAIMARFSAWRAATLALATFAVALFPTVLTVPGLSPSIAVLTCVGWASLLLAVLLYGIWTGRPMFPSLLSQLGLLLMGYLMIHSTLVGRMVGGIMWRGKLYTTALLKSEQKVKV